MMYEKNHKEKRGYTGIAASAILMMLVVFVFMRTALSACAADAGGMDDLLQDMPIVRTEESPCQFSMSAELPVHFSHSMEVTVRNITIGQNYRLILTDTNRYMFTGYVPTGSYIVSEIAVPSDAQGLYSFVYPQDFTLTAPNEVVELTTTLANYEEVERTIREKMNVNPEPVETEETGFFALGSWKNQEEQGPESDYEVMSESEGGSIGITGDPAGCYRIRIEVLAGTVPGDLHIRYTMFADSPWIEEDVPLSGQIALYACDAHGDQRDSGLTATFLPKSGMIFHVGDTFTSFVQAPENELIIDHEGDGAAELTVRTLTGDPDAFLPLYESNCRIVVEVLKTGSFSDAVIRVSTDGGTSFGEQTMIPGDGILPVSEAGIALCFSGNDNRALFHGGDCYTVRASKKNPLKRAMIVALLLALLGVFVFAVFSKRMRALIPGDEVYHIHPFYPADTAGTASERSRSSSSRSSRSHDIRHRGDR